MSELSPEGRQDVAAMNARTYAMSPADRAQWFKDHPASEFALTEAEALRQHLSTTPAHASILASFDLASMTRAELVQLHDDMPVTEDSCRGCPSQYR